MANTSITITWYHEGNDSTDIYTHEMSNTAMDRIVEAGRRIYGTMNAQTMLIETASKNRSRKEMSKEAVRLWKERARQEEITVAVQGVAANVPPIDSTEV